MTKLTVGRYACAETTEQKLPVALSLGDGNAGCRFFRIDDEAGNVRFAVQVNFGLPEANIHLLPDHSSSVLWIGFDTSVFRINLELCKAELTYSLPSPFSSFLALNDRVMIVHDSGVALLTSEGAHVWAYGADVIEDIRVEGGEIRLAFMDSPTAVLDLFTGEVRQPRQ